MELKIALIGDSNNERCKFIGWETLLQQIGVPYIVWNKNDGKDFQNYPICILTDCVNQNMINDIRNYIKDGGSVICSTDVLNHISEINTTVKYVKYLIPDEYEIYSDPDILDIFKIIKTVDDEKSPVYKGKVGKGNIIAFPLDVNELMLDVRSKKKSFYSNRKRLPYETVSNVSKGVLRRLVCNSIEYLFHSKKLPFVHLWYFPKDSKNIFSFRIDTDYGNKEQIEELYKLSLKYKIPFTWFVDVKSQKEWIDYYAKMNDQEIGVHCYEHDVYDSYAENYQNIRKALDVLKEVGSSPNGFASPYGKWNTGLAQAIRDHGFYYSSEFSYDYDNLPSNTMLFENPTSVLQIPVHPICIGSLKRQGFSGKEMIEYFHDQIDKKLILNNPIIFYHHPTHNHLEVIENLFNYVKEKNIVPMKMSDYAEWWNKRNLIKLDMALENDNLKIRSDNYSEDVYLRVTTADGREGIIKPQQSIDLREITYREKNKVLSPPKDIARSRRFNKWMLINKIEDYFHG
jgi:peptidoglycan/xylan/chitin deacetylase (PgdA/CDA1 family)